MISASNTTHYAPSAPLQQSGVASRLLSIDLLRGLTIAFMILVNNNGDEERAFWPLKHAVWNGFTPTDLVFPTFLLLVGVSVVLATQSRLARGVPAGTIFLSALRRTVVLIVLGIVVNSFPFFHLDTMRFYGVLQRIGICYFVAVVLQLISPGWKSKAAVLVAALVGYWALLRFVPVPGYGVPTQTVPLLDPTGNLVAWLDRQVFPANHLYEHVRDPEGLLSTLPAVGTILLGVLTGIWIRSARSLQQRVLGVAAAGTTLVILGALWNISFPINKRLWTSSYVLFAGGLTLLLLSVAMWLVDLRAQTRAQARADVTVDPKQPIATSDVNELGHPRLFRPLLVFGTNSISAYFLSEILADGLGNVMVRPRLSLLSWVYLQIHSVIANAAVASLIYSLLFVLVCWIPIYFLYRRRIFLKV